MIRSLTAVFCMAASYTVPAGSALAQDKSYAPQGVYLELTRDFYEALTEGRGGDATVYSNDPSSRRLEEIAVSTRFMVQTNLEILKQQEVMIQLLRSILEKQ